jgi:endonuclease/exonuclease/phosphatase family metal-dependent hydrolase
MGWASWNILKRRGDVNLCDRRPKTEEKMMEIKAASYNVHQCVGLDGRNEPMRIAEILGEMDCPIIGLQEVFFRQTGSREACQLRFFEDATRMNSIGGPARIIGDSCFGNVLLTTFPVVSAKLLDLTVTDREPRAAIDSVLKIRHKDVRVIVTHLGLSASERRTQIQKLLSTVEAHVPTMILGDLNEWIPMSRSMRWLEQQFGKSDAPRTFPAHFPVLKLDRIWSSHSSFLRSAAYSTRITRLASDHLPIRASIRID